jgi:hypothetical protein
MKPQETCNIIWNEGENNEDFGEKKMALLCEGMRDFIGLTMNWRRMNKESQIYRKLAAERPE